MNALIVLVATAALGIEVGWEPLPGGGHEYTLQLEPQLLKVLEAGQEEIFSEVPAGVDVRRYRIVVGVGKLRRDYGPLAAEIEQPLASARVTAPPQAVNSAPPASPFNQPIGESPDRETVPAADPYNAQGAKPPSADLESIPPAEEPTSAAPDFGLPAPGAVEPAFPAAESAGMNPPTSSSGATADDLWHSSAEQSVSARKAEQINVESSAAAKMAQAPAKLPEENDPSAPIRAATFEDGKGSVASGVVDTGEPELPLSEPNSQPWAPLVVTIVLLACSLGGNIFLGWIAADARARYRNATAKLRGAAV